jgi:hypothetical protein
MITVPHGLYMTNVMHQQFKKLDHTVMEIHLRLGSVENIKVIFFFFFSYLDFRGAGLAQAV